MSEQHALVVDDSKVGRITMLKKLESIGFRVDMVESGLQALEYLARHRPDMIFMDHMMPDMDGFEATRRIKASPATRDIPVIIISGNDDEDFVQQARAAGALHAIGKPPGPGVLEAILENLPKVSPAPEAVGEARAAPPAAVQPSAPGLDLAQVSETVEHLLGEAMASLRGGLLSDARKQMEAELEHTRGLLQHWGRQLDEARASVAGLLGNTLNPETVRAQFAQLDQRLHALEAAGQPALPDVEAIRAQMEQGLADRLADLESRLQATADALHRAQNGQAQRLEGLEQRMQARQADQPPPQVDEAALLAAMEARISPRLEALHQALLARVETPPPPQPIEAGTAERMETLQSELAALRTEVEAQRAQGEVMAQANGALRAEMDALQEALDAVSANLPAAVSEDARIAAPPPEDTMPTPAHGDAGVSGALQAELARLQARVKTMALALGVGGVVLAVGVLAALLR